MSLNVFPDLPGPAPPPKQRRPEQDDDAAGNPLARSLEILQENIRRAGPAASAGYTIVGAVVFLGAVGYGLDNWLGTSPWLLFAGLMLGIVVGFYELAKLLWDQ